jgi:hypothetical protein
MYFSFHGERKVRKERRLRERGVLFSKTQQAAFLSPATSKLARSATLAPLKDPPLLSALPTFPEGKVSLIYDNLNLANYSLIYNSRRLGVTGEEDVAANKSAARLHFCSQDPSTPVRRSFGSFSADAGRK